MLLASARDAKAELLAALRGPEGYAPPRPGAVRRSAAPGDAGDGRRSWRAAGGDGVPVLGFTGPPAPVDEAPDGPPAAGPDALPAVAVGVALLPDARFGLAVRVADPASLALPAVRALSGRGAEVDVRVVGDVVAATAPAGTGQRARTGLLRPGSSVAHPLAAAGTLGCFVTVEGYAGVGMLSCAHVLAANGRGRPGDPVLAPGPADGGTAADRVATLTRSLPLQPGAPNPGDVAAAVLDDPARAGGNDVTGGRLRGALDAAGLADLVASRRRPLRVAKTGRTTGTTRGRVTAVEVDGVRVGYGEAGRYAFDDCVEVAGEAGPFSRPGDSGSVVHTLSPGRLGVGLLFCGSASGGPAGAGVSYASGLVAALALVGARLLP